MAVPLFGFTLAVFIYAGYVIYSLLADGAPAGVALVGFFFLVLAAAAYIALRHRDRIKDRVAEWQRDRSPRSRT